MEYRAIRRHICRTLATFSITVISGLINIAPAEELVGTSSVVPESKAYIDEFQEPRKFAGPLDLPWGAAFLPDGRLLITEREGRLRVIQNGSLLTETIEGVPEAVSGGHSGLLDVLIDRDFERTHRIFLSYTHGVSGAITMRIMSAILEGFSLQNQKVIFDSRPAIGGVDEIGGRLAWGSDGLLYLTIGDRADKGRAQDLKDHSGSIVRLRDDGGVPEGNPFVGREDALPEIYSYGHRNPQGLVIGAEGQMWSIEHGPYGGDELNLVTAGGNYGWPLVTFGIEYDGSIISEHTTAPGMVDPVHKWVPSVAPSSLSIYRSPQGVGPGAETLLIGTLSGERLIKLTLNGNTVTAEEHFLEHTIGRIRNVIQGPDGALYMMTDGRGAWIYRMEPATEKLAKGDRPAATGAVK